MKCPHPCPLCGGFEGNERYSLSDRLHQTTDERFKLVECSGCGLLRLDPQPLPAALARYYPEQYWVSGDTRRGLAGLYRRLVLRDHLRFIRKAIRRLGIPRARVLDIGCGAGDILASLRRDHQAIGMDISASALRSAAEVGVAGVRAGYRHPPFADGTFDVVMMFHTLEHIPDPDAAIRAAGALLRSDGKLIIQVPNADSWQFALLGRFWSGLDPPRHLYDFRGQDLEAFLKSDGFQVMRRKFFSWRDNAPALATSLAPWMEPVARRVKRPRRWGPLRLAGDLAYFLLVMACLPFALVEAAFRHGSTIMLEANKVEAKEC